jgi:hypothetical protein
MSEACAYCGVAFGDDILPHTDEYHRGERALCGHCYSDPVAVRKTASRYDPASWWNRGRGPGYVPYRYSDLETRH